VDLELQIASHEDVSVLRCRGKLTYGPETNELVRTARQALETTKEIVLPAGGHPRLQVLVGVADGVSANAVSGREDGEIEWFQLSPRDGGQVQIVCPNAQITLRNLATHNEVSTVSNDAGM
jgi:hypothetical protein